MCGRFGFTDINGIYERYELENRLEGIKPLYNIAPSMRTPVITKNSPKKGTLMQFGFLPFWTKENKGYVINARAETIFEKIMFKKAITKNRCLVPANFFFEWKKTRTIKIPYVFSMKDLQTFSFAGIWTENIIDNNNLLSFAILTTMPNDIMKPIHNRMPLILTREQEESWLDSNLKPDDIKKHFTPCPSRLLTLWQVSSLVNNPANNTREIITPTSS